ncbi:MAG: Zn-dependent exopeptidase M28 [Solirubrobacteraceae bacterium]|nr:Zn-dependent exopeptidase M28 [Solirubrobacteraceae bacterium]
MPGSPVSLDDHEVERSPHRLLLIVLGAQLVIGAALLGWVAMGRPVPGIAEPKADAATLAPKPTVDRFDSARAWRLLVRQVKVYGPRPAGSAASRALADELVKKLPGGKLEPVPGGLQNVVGELPGKGAPIVVGAHYDTAVVVPGFVGANDGAGGTAAVVELARALARTKRPASAPPIRFVLFDGEELPADALDGEFERDALRGAKVDAAKDPRPRAMILLDFIAEKKGLNFPREKNSDKALWGKLRAASRKVGTSRIFPATTSVAITDDHIPYIRRGVPSINLIDFAFPQWHTKRDDLSVVSERSLDASGETVLELLRTWR